MASSNLCLVLLLIVVFHVLNSESNHSRKIYIVHVNGGSNGKLATRSSHMEVLEQILEDGSKASESHIYSYKESLTGFAARLTDGERKMLEGMEDILAVEPSREYELQTTRSWDFLGFPTNVNRPPGTAESNLIVGVLDSGIWPDSESFRDDGLGPPPSKWKGSCQNIKCNNKIIGAKAYYTGDRPLGEEKSVIDVEGHGTHTASTAAGMLVKNASFFGLGQGIARGGVPSARIAIYKVCWKTLPKSSCPEHDVMAALDDAIQDGVDIISASIGSSVTLPYIRDSLAIGSFRAMKRGILTSAAAGNSGPDIFTVSNGAPWILTVASSNTDRKFVGAVELGNGLLVTGNTINTFATQKSYYPLAYGPNATNASNANLIALFTLVNVDEATNSGARGLVAEGDSCAYVTVSFPLPTVCLSRSDSAKVTNYVNKTRNPFGKIYKSRSVLDQTAPQIALSSARGPNAASPDILKTDISAPGVRILAAWPPKANLGKFTSDKRSSPFNIISGTSMACPHATGIALYVKSFHPSWSPAAIKSALMTTATQMTPLENLGAELAYGSGLINPIKTLNPGLVYDATEADYVKFLCAEGYSERDIMVITGSSKVTCSNTNKFSTKDLNYPSMSARIAPNERFEVTFNRKVTNVGFSNSFYKVKTEAPTGVHVRVVPQILSFGSLGAKSEFQVVVSGGPIKAGTAASASLVWSDGKHSVRSPILIHALNM